MHSLQLATSKWVLRRVLRTSKDNRGHPGECERKIGVDIKNDSNGEREYNI